MVRWLYILGWPVIMVWIGLAGIYEMDGWEAGIVILSLFV